jgi:hypothetical protein
MEPKNRNAESVGEPGARCVRELLQSWRGGAGGTGLPGLRQPWARISQRLRRNEFGWCFTTHTPRLQAEFSANDEKAARCQIENACDAGDLQVALSVQRSSAALENKRT